jgi:hypothetical protein
VNVCYEEESKELTIDMETSHYRIETVCFFSSLAVFARMADILNGFESCSLANLKILDSFSYFDDDACAFVTRTLGAELRPEGVSIYALVMETGLAYMGGKPQSSIMKWTSDMQRPVTLSFIRTSSGPISGTGMSWTSIWDHYVNITCKVNGILDPG